MKGIIKFLSIWIVVLLIIGCLQKKSDTIKIGVSLPLTGDAALWGKSQKDGYDLALKQINDKGGINGKKIELLYGDDKGLAKEGLFLLQKFISIDKINILTGVANSSVALAYVPIIDINKILFISSGASSPKLTGVSKYFFRTWPSDIAEGIAMAKYAKNELHYTNIAILYINNDYGIGLLHPFSEQFTRFGGNIVTSQSFEQEATDFRTQLTKIKATKAEAIYLAGNPIEMGRVIKQARELGIQLQFLSISTLNDGEVIKATGDKALENTVITDASFDITSEREEVKEFLKDFRAIFNKEPGILANTAFDALTLLAYGIEKVGQNSDSLSIFFHNLKDYKGVSGIISFSEGGDVNRPIKISRFSKDKFDVIITDYIWY